LLHFLISADFALNFDFYTQIVYKNLKLNINLNHLLYVYQFKSMGSLRLFKEFCFFPHSCSLYFKFWIWFLSVLRRLENFIHIIIVKPMSNLQVVFYILINFFILCSKYYQIYFNFWSILYFIMALYFNFSFINYSYVDYSIVIYFL
jgi:hypothetical protein